ncbi:MAG: response regulator [Nitrospirota bacterium]
MRPDAIRILMADDDPFVRDMVGFILESSDYTVETAENGREALEKYKAGSGFHVIISDMNMPEMDGRALIREVRSIDPDIPIILLTGTDDAASAKSGADECIVKDENIQDAITASVDAVLRRKGLVS